MELLYGLKLKDFLLELLLVRVPAVTFRHARVTFGHSQSLCFCFLGSPGQLLLAAWRGAHLVLHFLAAFCRTFKRPLLAYCLGRRAYQVPGPVRA